MSREKNPCDCCGSTEAGFLFEKDGFDIVRCSACGLVRVANPPDSAALARLYSFEAGYHQELVEDAHAQSVHAQEAQDNLRRLQRFRKSGSLLDVGCSTGLFLAAARASGWTVRGVEYSADAAQQARQNYGLDVITGALDARVLQGQQFDVITLWDVLEHVPSPAATLQEVRELLKPDGLLLIKTPNVDGWFPRLSLKLAGRLGFWRHPEPPGHLFQFSEATLKACVTQAGMQAVQVLHGRIPVTYSFGQPKEWLRSVKWAGYCAVFIPLAWLGPAFGAGDDMTMVCRAARS